MVGRPDSVEESDASKVVQKKVSPGSGILFPLALSERNRGKSLRPKTFSLVDLTPCSPDLKQPLPKSKNLIAPKGPRCVLQHIQINNCCFGGILKAPLKFWRIRLLGEGGDAATAAVSASFPQGPVGGPPAVSGGAGPSISGENYGSLVGGKGRVGQRSQWWPGRSSSVRAGVPDGDFRRFGTAKKVASDEWSIDMYRIPTRLPQEEKKCAGQCRCANPTTTSRHFHHSPRSPAKMTCPIGGGPAGLERLIGSECPF